MYRLITGFHIDYAKESFNLMKKSVFAKNGCIIIHLPYPRFCAIMIGEVFEEGNVEFPTTEEMWKTPMMVPL
ncbi:hypothetical protein HanRHA438_Chr10g0448241 [Helianthus annuus]|nr:hypothetical protein HanRHA438_Chr10g0448241 [Helianthus annuus]